MNRHYRPLFLVDPNVTALIKDLGLCLGSPPPEFLAACRRPKFCDIVKAFHARKNVDRAQLCREIYLRNRSRSCYVHRSYTD